MDWSKIGKFLVDNQDDIKKMAEDTAKAVRCANNLHEQHKSNRKGRYVDYYGPKIIPDSSWRKHVDDRGYEWLRSPDGKYSMHIKTGHMWIWRD